MYQNEPTLQINAHVIYSVFPTLNYIDFEWQSNILYSFEYIYVLQTLVFKSIAMIMANDGYPEHQPRSMTKIEVQIDTYTMFSRDTYNYFCVFKNRTLINNTEILNKYIYSRADTHTHTHTH